MVNKQTTNTFKTKYKGFQYFSSLPVLHYLQAVLFFIKIGTIFMTILYNSLKSGDTKDNIRQVKVPGTALYWKAWIILIVYNHLKAPDHALSRFLPTTSITGTFLSKAPTNNIPVINKYFKGKENLKACHGDLHF